MGIIESNKEKVHNLCKAAIALNHDDFKALIGNVNDMSTLNKC